ELDVRLWVKANRPGIQLFARVVLPRSRDPQGQPLVAVLPGGIYQNAGTWQALELAQVPALLETVGRGLRVTYGPNVDLREAYVDRLLLNVAGGPGLTAIWIDDLHVAGLVETKTAARPAFRPVSTSMSGDTQ